ncbi:folylpolyglutamate synthase/dihydrofolate synthase family protein [Myroides ceti]|uniref:Dihydrofolate synthase/folylpolyglutamate synthase n=2 Tax=Paenimyroides ceti TaxID=395087 RepID=A0ABT8CSX9_9FLAO|nr:folylpolyglutamate synthase/dihydrofolate synthase family protein [Paenimyroides ceti]MDN3707612.1 folylpolyglutamate synthase/dihydrofolate synthase family protein [Paenimyroides ceti]
MYHKVGAAAYKKDLNNTWLLSEHLSHPERKIKTIHIGGTNGKGSTSSMISSILQEAGYKVGLYTSPHLIDFRERIKINNEMIPEKTVIEFIEKNKAFLQEKQLSFFEMTVGLAFDYFAKEQVDVAVIEVGLGGRLDSTNIISPLVSVITNIGWDHMAMLGNSLEEIAFEKAGIIKKETPVIIGEYTATTKNVFLEKAKEMQAPLYFASDMDNYKSVESDLKGNYQQYNKRTVQVVIDQLRSFFSISRENEIEGFRNVVKNTGLQGRWQQLSDQPLIIADTAHNKDGLKQTMQQVREQKYDKLYFVFGIVNDKDVEAILLLLPLEAKYFIAKPNIPRGMETDILAEKMTAFGFDFEICNSIPVAYEKAKVKAQANDMIYVGGSTFVVAEIL